MKINTHSTRSGLSIIEVLTAIVVASIGVFGVMALIPFSVKQSQSGLDRDAATNVARNALARFEAEGHKFVSRNAGMGQLNWQLAGGRQTTSIMDNNNLICIDPLGVAERGFETFPFNLNGSRDGSTAALMPNPADPLQIPSATLVRPGNTVFTTADARRLFRITDELSFGDPGMNAAFPEAELNGPTQIFNSSNGNPLNRQSTGSISWCALAQPNVNVASSTEVDSYKFFIMVFKDRTLDVTALESRMAAATVTDPVPGTTANPLSTIMISSPPNNDIRREDWVMLINEGGTGPTRAARTNLAFARVTNLVPVDTDGDNLADATRLTLDGPDFNFVGTTQLVHLQDVLSVYSRTIKLETPSTWNISF